MGPAAGDDEDVEGVDLGDCVWDEEAGLDDYGLVEGYCWGAGRLERRGVGVSDVFF